MLRMIVQNPKGYKTYVGALRKLEKETAASEEVFLGLIGVRPDGQFVPVVVNPPPMYVGYLAQAGIFVCGKV